jgi:hypothetical protein
MLAARGRVAATQGPADGDSRQHDDYWLHRHQKNLK